MSKRNPASYIKSVHQGHQVKITEAKSVSLCPVRALTVVAVVSQPHFVVLCHIEIEIGIKYQRPKFGVQNNFELSPENSSCNRLLKLRSIALSICRNRSKFCKQ